MENLNDSLGPSNNDGNLDNKPNSDIEAIKVLFYVIGIILLIMSIVYLFKANAFLDGGAKLWGSEYRSMHTKYVGGDAYNYIIAGTYSTTLTVRALFFGLWAALRLFLEN